MSKDVKKWTLARLKEEEDDVLSTEILSGLLIDEDFVWIEKPSTEAIPREDHLDNNSKRMTNTEIISIAQHDSIKGNNESPEECQMQSESVDTESETMIPTEWDRDLTVEQQYLEQYGPVVQRANSSRPKYPASQRLTVKQLKIKENRKVINRDPSHYKFDFPTTCTLKQFVDKKYVQGYHNVVGKGTNSLVIHAGSVDRYDICGYAVKVYGLSDDVKKNNTILKRVQREYTHLQRLQHCYYSKCLTSRVRHIMKNVIMFHFIGFDQEPALSISRLPSEYSQDLYERLVNDMDLWYTRYNMVHGKLCVKNIRFYIISDNYWSNYRGSIFRPHIIGWGHSVGRDHPQALVKLMRDCYFVTNFFKRRDVPVKSTEELFKHITGLDKISSKVLDAVKKKDLWQKGHLTNPNRQYSEGNQKRTL